MSTQSGLSAARRRSSSSARNQINQGSLDAASSMEAFEKMEEKADQMLDAANAKAELGKTGNEKLAELESKYDAKAGAVEDELAALKEKLGK